MALSLYHGKVILSTSFNMGGRGVWVVIAVLVGTSLFGIFKSLTLLRENDRLGQNAAFLTTELEGVKKELRAVMSDLSESRLINAQLEDDAAGLKGKLAKAEERLLKFEEYAVLLKKKYGEVLVKATSLDEANRQMSERLLRLNLENQEFRMKLSSEKGLKEAIRELKRARRKPVARASVSRGVGAVTRPAAPDAVSQPSAALEAGNQGFLVKDGRSTIEQLVDIRVESVSAPDENGKGD